MVQSWSNLCSMEILTHLYFPICNVLKWTLGPWPFHLNPEITIPENGNVHINSLTYSIVLYFLHSLLDDDMMLILFSISSCCKCKQWLKLFHYTWKSLMLNFSAIKLPSFQISEHNFALNSRGYCCCLMHSFVSAAGKPLHYRLLPEYVTLL